MHKTSLFLYGVSVSYYFSSRTLHTIFYRLFCLIFFRKQIFFSSFFNKFRLLIKFLKSNHQTIYTVLYGSGLCLPVLDHINAIYISACFLALKIFISMFLSFKKLRLLVLVLIEVKKSNHYRPD